MNNLKYNGSGCMDLVAYKAIVAADNEREVENIMKERNNKKNNYVKENKTEDQVRLDHLMAVIFKICEIAGFHLENRIVLKDIKTGKIYK